MAELAGLGFVECGIASALMQYSLDVPLNQRSYKWTDQIQSLLEDLTKAFSDNEKIYFLGMIVLTYDEKGHLEVADGQQRLATTSIIISAVRDYLIELKDDEAANAYQSKYLIEYDPPSGEYKPKLQLNHEDRDFFTETILKPINKREEFKGRRFMSHDRLEKAVELAKEYIRNLTTIFTQEKEKQKRLYEWMDFLRESARVIVITVPASVGNAYKMFETLNARGLKASQIDVLKNYLFDKGQNKIDDIHPRWTSMLSTIDDLSDSENEDDLLLDYIRYYWIAHNGPTTERQLGDKIQRYITGERQALDFVIALDSFAEEYAALNMPREHSRLNDFNIGTRNCIYTIIKELGVKQILPLMLAILKYFEVPETTKAFELCLSWTVRFLIAGGGGGGVLDRQYGLRAKEVSSGEVKTAKALSEKMSTVIHNDETFKSAFEIAYVRQVKLARYYLKAIDLYLAEEKYPQFVPSEDTRAVNAEHVLPVTPGPDWDVPPDVATSHNKRLGNIALLGSQTNVRLGNDKFEDKKDALKKSPFLTTQWIAEYEKWGPEEITDRQKKLAELAPKIWPI